MFLVIKFNFLMFLFIYVYIYLLLSFNSILQHMVSISVLLCVFLLFHFMLLLWFLC